MDGDRVVKRASARAADGGFRDRSLSQLSGGQWRRASLALELAFAELARQQSRFSCNLLVLDEVLSQLDAYGRARVRCHAWLGWACRLFLVEQALGKRPFFIVFAVPELWVYGAGRGGGGRVGEGRNRA